MKPFIISRYRVLVVLIFIAISAAVFGGTAACHAYEYAEPLNELKKAIPSDIVGYIPENAFGYDPLEPFIIDTNLLFKAVADFLLALIRPVLSVFCTLCGFVILSSVFSALKNTVSSSAVSTAFELASGLCMALCLFSTVSGLWDAAYSTLEQLNTFMNSMLPVMTGLYAVGGNITTAVVNNASMLALINFMENICYYALYPLLQICFGLSLAAQIGHTVNLSGVSALVRNTFTIVLAFIMSILTLVLTYQTRLTLGADNVASRTIRFAAGSFIPVVGGAVSEAMRVLAGGLGYVKAAAGTITVLAIMLIVLPVILRIFLNKMMLSAASCLAGILGSDRERGFIGEISGMLNFLLALVTSCSVLFILNVSLFIQSATFGG